MIQSLTLVLSGQAGQGLATIENLLVDAIKSKYHVFSTKEVMSRVRGGNNTVEIRLASEPVYAYKHQIDILFLLNDQAYYRLDERVSNKTVILGEESYKEKPELVSSPGIFKGLPLTDLAKESGSVLFKNTILFGFIAGMLDLDPSVGHELIKKRFAGKIISVIENNIKAFDSGFDLGVNHSKENHGIGTFDFTSLTPVQTVASHKIIDGTKAVGIGALAGGVNYIASYPMSPATGVLEFLAAKGNDFDIVVEQAEDEIAALNMVIGGWYAGARSIATTSGGGFALMEEAVSLSGITETPAVIHIAQRPGPGTGLPTRTEQADLNLAVYSGHGEFPRIVLAPGSLEDGILLTQRAFYLADKYQLPVFVLSDQYYLDSKSTVVPLSLDDTWAKSFVVKSDSDYLRYKLTDDGISPRAIPGYGDGLVKCDSDEHDERGSITEDFNVRIKMNDKRIGKESLSLNDYVQAELVGPKDYDQLVIGWGSTYGVLKEAVISSESKKVAFLHLKQVYPLSDKLKSIINQASTTILFENNATGQLRNLLKLHLDIHLDHTELKYNGMPFTIEEVDKKLKEVLS